MMHKVIGILKELREETEMRNSSRLVKIRLDNMIKAICVHILREKRRN